MSSLRNMLLRPSCSGYTRTFLSQIFHVAPTCRNSGKIFLEYNMRILSISLKVFSTFIRLPQLFWSFPVGCFWTSGHSFTFLCALSIISLKYSTQNRMLMPLSWKPENSFRYLTGYIYVYISQYGVCYFIFPLLLQICV